MPIFGMRVLVLAALVVASVSADAQSARGAAGIRNILAKQPHNVMPRHNAAELLVKFQSTAAGKASLAAAHRIATTATAASSKSSGGSGSGATQSSQPGGASGTTSTTSTASAGTFAISMDPTRSLTASTSDGGSTVRAGLQFINASGGQGPDWANSVWYLTPADTTPSSVNLSVDGLAPGWYVVSFDMWAAYIPMTLAGNITGFSNTWTAPTTECTASTLSPQNGAGMGTCMALVQIPKRDYYQITFALTTGMAQFATASIVRVNP